MLLIAQAVATFAMTGLIWLVQLVHYPGFAYVDESQFTAFHGMHSVRITWIVAPLMVVELVASLGWCIAQPQRIGAYVGLALVAVIWGSTALLQVPLHNQLADGPVAGLIERLVATNWLRTAAWTARSALVATWLVWALPGR